MNAVYTQGRESWLVALDIDGTIAHENGFIDPQVRAAIAQAQSDGHHVTIATGRSWATTHEVLHGLGLNPEYVVCGNGAIIMRRDPEEEHGYRIAHVETFDPTAVLMKLQEHLPNGHFMVELADGFRLYTIGLEDWNLDRSREVTFPELFAQQATRVVVSSPIHDSDEFVALVERAGLHSVSYSVGFTAWLDIAPDGVNKATALERVREWWGIPRSRVFAIGDGRNDIEMLHWAASEGRGVAMGQAAPEVLDASNERTGTIEEAGLATALTALAHSKSAE